MKKIQNILGCLDLTDIDPVLIRWASFMAQTLQAETLLFLHLIQTYNLPDLNSENFPDEKRLTAIVNKELEGKICDHCDREQNTRLEIRPESEDAAGAVIDYVRENRVDLVLVGQKPGQDRQSRYAQRISVGIDSDLMLISGPAEPAVPSILCAVDCSRESKPAFAQSRNLAQRLQAGLSCFYLEDTTRSYFPSATVKTSQSREKQARKAYEAFLQQFSLTPADIPCHFDLVDREENQTESVYAAAEKDGAGLIAVGARGAVSTETSLLGNVTQNFLHMEKERPVLIIKNQKSKRFFQDSE